MSNSSSPYDNEYIFIPSIESHRPVLDFGRNPNHRYTRTFNSWEQLSKANQKAIGEFADREELNAMDVDGQASKFRQRGDLLRANYIDEFAPEGKSAQLYTQFSSALKDVNSHLYETEISKKYYQMNAQGISWLLTWLHDFDHNQLKGKTLNQIVLMSQNALLGDLTVDEQLNHLLRIVKPGITANEINKFKKTFPDQDDRETMVSLLEDYSPEDFKGIPVDDIIMDLIARLGVPTTVSVPGTKPPTKVGSTTVYSKPTSSIAHLVSDLMSKYPRLTRQSIAERLTGLLGKDAEDELDLFEGFSISDYITHYGVSLPNGTATTPKELETYLQPVMATPGVFGYGLKKTKKKSKSKAKKSGGKLVGNLPPLVNIRDQIKKREIVSGERGAGHDT
jgi:hypothetical protein